MTLEQLQTQRNQLALQRAQAKDAVENLDKALAQIDFGIQVLEKQETKESDDNDA